MLAADTTVVLGNEIIGKPDNARHARSMLRRSGKSYQVLTAIMVAYEDRIESALSASTVEFRTLGNGEISRYVRSGESPTRLVLTRSSRAACLRKPNGSYLELGACRYTKPRKYCGILVSPGVNFSRGH